MFNLVNFTKHATIAVAVACVAVPSMALADIGDFAPGGNGPDGPGPGNWGGPDGFAAPAAGDSGPAPVVSEGNGFVSQRVNECPNGNLVVDFELDPDGHPIPSSFSRFCIPFQ